MTSRAGYSGSRQDFLADSSDAILGSLAANALFGVDLTQRNAWLTIIRQLKSAILDLQDAFVFLEFTIPRMGRRVDAILVNGGCIFVIEYKVGCQHYYLGDVDQVTGYALDLKNFHEPSHSVPIIPMLIATGGKHAEKKFRVAKTRSMNAFSRMGKTSPKSSRERLPNSTPLELIRSIGHKVDIGRHRPS